MTLTIELPDEAADQIRAATESQSDFSEDVVYRLVMHPPKGAIQTATVTIQAKGRTVIDAIYSVSANEKNIAMLSYVDTILNPTEPVNSFAGDGRPRPISSDVRAYLNAMRDEWDKADSMPAARPESYDPLPWDEFAELMIEGIDPNAPLLSEYATRREGMYEDRY